MSNHPSKVEKKLLHYIGKAIGKDYWELENLQENLENSYSARVTKIGND